ncbi:MAG: efflux transporter periplasmic adaptor subunit [Hyphomicrobiales bacterium]|nr:MAG: efflux transporter periplasmic adaptor subunit [Hyphomicrobiales bacterium]
MKASWRAVFAAAVVYAGSASGAAFAAETLTVEPVEIEDTKTVYAEVRSVDTIPARARIGGTVAELTVDEGMSVTAEQQIATVGDTKLALKLDALAAQIRAVAAEVENARTELERGKQLQSRGIIAQARLDTLATAFEVASKKMESAEAERSVVVQQLAEGAVVAPQAGRVLSVPVTAGSVVLPGETIATIAAEGYILRLEVPERHARFMKEGDVIFVGDRELDKDTEVRTGTIQQVYPELQNGRVVADAAVADLGSYFVGERALVRVSAGTRTTFLLPEDYVFTRYGTDFVKLQRGEGEPIDVVVQLGQIVRHDDKPFIEVLSGVAAGDRLVKP